MKYYSNENVSPESQKYDMGQKKSVTKSRYCMIPFL